MTTYTNHAGLPEPVVLALTDDNYSRGASNRSVTQLIDSPRAQILRDEHDDKVVIDVSELIWVANGKAMHLLFEKYAGGKYNPEERMFAEVNGWTISGQIDLQHDDTQKQVALTDYKVTSVWSVIYGKEEWNNQLNAYAWLVETSKNVRVTKAQILAVMRDWKQRDAMNDRSYPQFPIMLIDIPLWDLDKRDAYVLDRVKIHQDAAFNHLLGDKLPPCTDAERWKSPSQFAVKKPKNKRAQRVFSSSEEAQQYIDDNDLKGLEIEERPSDPRRCSMGYCKIAQWCDQYQAELGKGE